MNDPKYKRYNAGFWDFERTNGANGECSATFVSLDGAITIAGPIGDQGNAAVMFWGGSIPRPAQAGMKEATLNQTGQSPATVKTQHYAVDGSELGVLAFAIPDPRVLVDGILDIQNFSVSLAGQKVFDGGWSDGAQARKKMTACFAKLGK